MQKLMIPVSYQGGKHRLAGQIVDHIQYTGGQVYDVCCGTGAISIELINRGAKPEDITMIDLGPWGEVWKHVGAGSFSLPYFQHYLEQIPPDRRMIKEWATSVAEEPVYFGDVPYLYLILQAASFGAKAIWLDGDRWQHHGFRAYWEPKPTSRYRYPINPMHPMPGTIYARMEEVCKRMRGVRGRCVDATAVHYVPHSCLYIDPPYQGTLGYGHTLFLQPILDNTPTCRVYVSEQEPLTQAAVQLTGRETRGGVSGQATHTRQEWLSFFNEARPL